MLCDCFTEWVLCCFPGSACGISNLRRFCACFLEKKVHFQEKNLKRLFTQRQSAMLKHDKVKISGLDRYESDSSNNLLVPGNSGSVKISVKYLKN